MGIRDDVWNLMVPGGSWELGLHSVSVLAGRKAEGGSLSYSQAQLSPVWSLVTSVRTARDKLSFWFLDWCDMRSVSVNWAGTAPQGQGEDRRERWL